jgi:ribosomal protein L7/L12
MAYPPAAHKSQQMRARLARLRENHAREVVRQADLLRRAELINVLFTAGIGAARVRELTGLSSRTIGRLRTQAAGDRPPQVVTEVAAVPPPSPEIAPELELLILNHLAAGQKVTAIKTLRAVSGLELKEAKDRVEAIGAQRAARATNGHAAAF